MLATTAETWAAIGVSAAVTLLLIGPALAAAFLVVERCIADPSGYDRAIDDVQRFVDLTERSRALLRSAPRLPLLDPAGADAVSAATDRALTVKEAARRALWGAPARSGAEPADALDGSSAREGLCEVRSRGAYPTRARRRGDAGARRHAALGSRRDLADADRARAEATRRRPLPRRPDDP
ncbi:MAG TPA: hypothetical protein VFA66_07470 [Gaiellaceae bacterium]|nr:hypothetical protein [Gaiellaceae bacterium]